MKGQVWICIPTLCMFVRYSSCISISTFVCFQCNLCVHTQTKINTQNVCTGTYFFILCIKQTNLHTFPCASAVVHLFTHPCADIHSYIPTSQYIPCAYVFNSIKKSLFFTVKHTPERPSAVLWTAD